jgi:hypothetical protein
MVSAKKVVVMLLTVLGAVHCGAASEETTTADDAELSAADGDDVVTEQKPAPKPETPPASSSAADTHPFLAAPTIRITSSYIDPHDGSRYVTGVFKGNVVNGGWSFSSQGGDDVFLAKMNASNQIEWARAIGSRRTESDPSITFENGQLNLIAFTRGQVDCGQGPLNAWTSKMFFRCVYGADGTPISSGSFPTGTP